MVERLTVIFFIILCLLLGFYLILAPWDTLFGPWGQNYILAFISDKSGLPSIQAIVASMWFRGGVTGLGAGTGLCEVCHDATLFYRHDGGPLPHHQKRCTECHTHAAGLKPSHGEVPG